MRVNISVLVALILAAMLFSISTTARAEEQILSYDVQILIRRDATLHVTENITVHAENNEIKRGIYRDFPTDYRDRAGNKVSVDFEVEKVLKDGRPENYFTTNRDNGVRTYIGKKNVFVSPGVHEYTLVYTTNRQLGFFEQHDELYFNAIPHGFTFPIQKAQVTVYLPEDVPQEKLRVAAYTGSQGSRDRNASSRKIGNSVVFTLTEPLHAFQGMTIVVGFPKGLVDEPDIAQRSWWFFADNLHWLVLLIGLGGTYWYYLATWRRVGRDPEPGAIIPRWEPPEGYSAADMVYVLQRGGSPSVIAACIVEAAVKGWIEIEESSGTTTLKKSLGTEPLSKEAKTFYFEIFDIRTEIELDNANHSEIRSAMRQVYEELDREHRKQSFVLNRQYLFKGMVLSVLTIVLFVALNVWSTGEPNILPIVLLATSLMILNAVFARLLQRPTLSGRRDLDRIEGFKMYLDSAERDTFRELGAPHDSLEIFERFLPFAVALGVDYNWGTRFQDIIEKAIAEDTINYHRAHVYQSSYSRSGFTSRGLSSSLSTAIASSSTPPGSSSGGGGGGSSGGGGGGGGGGGW